MTANANVCIHQFLQITLTHTIQGYFIPADAQLVRIDDKQLKQMTSTVYVALISSCQYCDFRVKYGITKLPEQYHGNRKLGSMLPCPAMQCFWEYIYIYVYIYIFIFLFFWTSPHYWETTCKSSWVWVVKFAYGYNTERLCGTFQLWDEKYKQSGPPLGFENGAADTC